jgi:signal transduction histidine kinase
MRARVEQAGGTLTISTAPGHGTTIRTEMPA